MLTGSLWVCWLPLHVVVTSFVCGEELNRLQLRLGLLRRLKNCSRPGFLAWVSFASSGGPGVRPTAPRVRHFWWTWSAGGPAWEDEAPRTWPRNHLLNGTSPLSSSISLSTHTHLCSPFDIDFAFRCCGFSVSAWPGVANRLSGMAISWLQLDDLS